MEKIGKYNITGEIGRGAMGIVYKGEDPVIGRPVAIKTIRFDTLTLAKEQENAQRRFMREARSAGSLSHPNIVTIYDVGEDEGLTYIVMEFIEGQSLEELITAGQRFSMDEIIAIMAQIGDALDFAHSKGIVHRDIKPGNILLDLAGRPHIVDFGIARISSSTMTQTSMVMGTPFYMSPEQISGKKVDNRADIFSLGAVLYEMLTLQKAFPGDSITTVIYKIVNEHPVPARHFQQDLPDGLDHILHTALAKDSSQRYSSCTEMVQDLQNYPAYAGMVPDTPSPPQVIPPPMPGKTQKKLRRTGVPSVAKPAFEEPREKSRKPLLYVLGAMMVVVVFVIAAVVFFSQNGKKPVVSGGGGPPVQQKILPEKKPREEPRAEADPEVTLPDQIRSFEELANKLFEEGDNAGAIVFLEKILELDPDHHKAELDLGLALADQGRLDEAEKKFENFLAKNPDDPAPHLYLGLLFNKRNDPEQALAHLKIHVDLSPEGSDVDEAKKNISALEEEIRKKQRVESDPPPDESNPPQKEEKVTELMTKTGEDPVKKPEQIPVKKPAENQKKEIKQDLPVGPDEKTTEISTLLDQGIRAFDANRYDQSVLRMQEILKLDPQNSVANYYINKAKKARAAQQKRQSIRNLLRGAKSDLDNNRFDRSIERARRVLQLEPGNTEASSLEIQAAIAKEEYTVRSLFETYKREFEAGNLEAFFKKYCIPAVYNKEKAKARIYSLYHEFSSQFSAPEIIMNSNGSIPGEADVRFRQVSKAVSKAQGKEGELVNGSYKWELKKIGQNWMITKITFWGR